MITRLRSTRLLAHAMQRGPAMNTNDIRRRLEQELRITKSRLDGQGWPTDPASAGQTAPAEAMTGDPFDRIEHTESRERHLDSRERRTERMDRIPEATTCVRCQESLEAPRNGQGPIRSFRAEARVSLDEDE